MVSRFTSSFAHVIRVVLIGAFSLAAAASAQAQVTAEQRAACTPDAMRLCSSEIPDVGRVTACMNRNRANLSARCQAVFASATGGAPRHHYEGRATRVASAHSRVASTKHFTRHARYASAYGYRHHGHSGWGQSAQAMAIAQQVMSGFAQACGSQSLPPEICSMSGNLGSMGGISGLGSLSSLMRY
jgi:hypothetical protein